MSTPVHKPSSDTETLTLAEQAYRALQHDIMSGNLAPGQPLRLEYLKQRYDLSFTPLREALNRLHGEHLVDAIALKGFRVAPLSLKEMHDAISARILVDCEALSRSIDRADDDWEAGIVAALHALDRVAQRQAQPEDTSGNPADSYPLVEQRHLALHRALIAACQSRWLLEFSMTLYKQTERYRRPALLNLGKTSEPRDVSAEHHAIVEAALARDKTRASQLLSEHYAKTARYIEQNLDIAKPLPQAIKSGHRT